METSNKVVRVNQNEFRFFLEGQCSPVRVRLEELQSLLPTLGEEGRATIQKIIDMPITPPIDSYTMDMSKVNGCIWVKTKDSLYKFGPDTRPKARHTIDASNKDGCPRVVGCSEIPQ